MRTLLALKYLRPDEYLINWRGDIVLLERHGDGGARRIAAGIATINKLLSARQAAAERAGKALRYASPFRLRSYWMEHSDLTPLARFALMSLIEIHPKSVTAETLAHYAAYKKGRGTNYSHTGGAFLDAIRILRRFGLITGSANALSASAWLF